MKLIGLGLFWLVLSPALFAAPLRVSPDVEGLYDIQNYKSKRSEPLRFVVMNSLGSRGVVLSITDPDLGYPKYIFAATKVESAGQVIEAINTTNRQSEVRVEIDAQSGRLDAWLRDVTTGGDTHIVAKLKYRTKSLFHTPGPELPMKYLEGAFLQKTYPEGTLYIQFSPTLKSWRAQMVYNVGVTTNFHHVNVDLSTRTVELTHQRGPYGEYTKWVLAIEANEETEEVKLKGMWFDNFYGRAVGLELNKK